MRVMRSILLLPMFVLVSTVTASAQATQARDQGQEQRGYVSGSGAIVSPAAPAFAVEYGDNINRNVLAYVTLSYFENLMKQPLRDDLATLGSNLATLTGDAWALSGRDRGVALIAGGKYLLGSGNVRPYVGGGAGIISLRRTVTEARLGDVRDAIFNDFAVGEADLSLAVASLTQPIVEAAIGVGIANGNAYFDIGYRYRRAFRLFSSLNFSQIGVGVGYRF